MPAYSDVPAINALYQEVENVSKAIACIDNNGTMTSVSISGGSQATPFQMMGTTVNAPEGTVDSSVNAMIRGWLVERKAYLNDELTKLGVTVPVESKQLKEGED